MKKLLKISLFSLLFLSLGCTQDDNDTLTGSETEGGYIDVITQGVTYAQGQPATDLLSSTFSLFQGNEKVEKVEVYKQFYGKVNVGTPTTVTGNPTIEGPSNNPSKPNNSGGNNTSGSSKHL